MKKLVVLSLAGVLAACAAPMWHHPSNNEYDFNRDKAVCSMEANRANPSTAVPYNPRLDPFQQANASIYNGTADMGRDLPPLSHTKPMELSPLILENGGYEDHTIYRRADHRIPQAS
jgi:hypothetical protein